MINVTRIHDAGSIVINADLIETIEACPDTTITLVTKRRFVVADSVDDVIARIIEFRRNAASPPMGGRVQGNAIADAA
jgi:flagellar protein FlbD